MVADFSKKQKSIIIFRDILPKIAGVLLIFIFALLLIADFRIYKKKQHLDKEILSYEKQLEQIKKRNETLKEGITNSENPDYIEKIAREEQNMQKPGEKVVSFIWPENQQQSDVYAENFESLFTGWFSGFWNWLKSKF